MLDRRKNGKQRSAPLGIVPEEPAVFGALMRAGVVVVMGAKPGTKAAVRSARRLKSPR